MPDAHPPEARPRKRLRLLKWLCISLFAFLGILAVTIYFLPVIASSDWARSLLQAKASRALQRPVHIERLRWTWSEGITLHSLRIEDAPAFSKEPLFEIKDIALKIGLSDLFRRRFNANFVVEGLNLRVIRNREGVTNVEVLFSSFPKEAPKEPQPAKTLDEWRKLSFSLPFEVQGSIALRNMSINMEDRFQGRNLLFSNLSISAEIASLAQKSLRARVSSEIELDGARLLPLRFEARVQDLFTPKGELSLAGASVVAGGSLPGVSVDVNCDLKAFEVKNRVKVELPELMKIVRPFLSPAFSNVRVAGVLELVMNTAGDPTKNLRLNLAFSGLRLGVTGGPFKERPVGPLRFTMTSAAELDINKGKVRVDKGELRFLERSVISWQGSIEKTGEGQGAADFTISPISVDVGEVYRAVSPFLPKDMGFSFEGLSEAHSLTVGKVKLSGSVPKGGVKLVLDDLSLRVPAANVKQKEMSVFLGGSSLSVKNLTVLLNDLFPTEAAGTLSLHMDGLQVKGPKEVIVKGIDVSSLEISASDIRKEEEALFGVAGRIGLSEVQAIGMLSIPGTAEIRDLKESLSVEVLLPAAKSAEVEVKEFKVRSPSVLVWNGKSVPGESPFSLSTSLSMVLRKGAEYEGEIKGLRSEISMGTMLSAWMDLTAKGWGFGELRTEGKVKADFSQLMACIPQEMARGLKLSGTAEMGWSFAGRVPGKEEMEGLRKPEEALGMLRDKDILRSLDLRAGLSGLSVEMSAEGGKRVRVEDVSTPKPFRVVMEKGLKKAELSGAVSASIKELPSLEKLKEPIRIVFDVSGSEEMLKTVKIRQSLEIPSLNLKQEAHLAASGLDQVLGKGIKGSVAEILGLVAGKAGFSLDIAKVHAPLGAEEITVTGQIALGADIDLVPGREIGLKGWMKAPGLDLTFGKWMDMKDLKSSLSLEKRYGLFLTEKTGPAGPSLPYLSVQVLKPAAEAPRRARSRGPVERRLMSDVRSTRADQRTFSAESIKVGLKPVPVHIKHAGLDVRLEEGLPSIDLFEADVIGGTVRGSLSLRRRSNTFFVDFRSAFSGLNAGRLIGESSRDIRDEEAEISGRMSAALPLSTSVDRLLQDMEFDVEITHIGAVALERMLYAVDPYENNESIVQQRKLLRMGTPRWVMAALKDGLLSVSGEVAVKGVKLELPKLERLNVGSLPGLGGIEKRLAVIGPLIKILTFLSADTIEIDKAGKVRLLYIGD